MTNRSSLPVQLTLINSPNFRFQIRHDGHSPLGLSQLLQSQGVQETQNTELQQPDGSVAADITVDISGPENVGEQQGNQPSSDSQNADQTNGTDNSIAAIRQFLQQNPELYHALKKFLTYIPFIILILLKEICKHTTEILVVLTLAILS